MNSLQVEKNLEVLIENFSEKEFVFDLLLAYGVPKATVTLLKKGKHNLSKKDGRIILKKKLFFQSMENEDLHVTIDSLQRENATMKHEPRFIVVTDYKTLLAVDTKTKEQLDIEIKNIAKYYDFFLPWAGIEKHRHKSENPADRKAAEKMAKLYDVILAENSIDDEKRTHDLNVFLSRLLFCFFAEDTDIFEEKIFTNSIASHTQVDGSDLDVYLGTLFDILNTQETSSYPKYLQRFPYVNGGLFAKKHWIPKFSSKSRKIIVECGELNWAEINPDIFGSMMQAVTHPGQRASLGMHYTSVPNIMKVVEPLFLNELKDEFEKYRDNKKKLKELLGRITRIKFFDPACGSGNFLIIAYKELRRLEMKIIKELNMLSLSGIHLDQFYGIEIDDFAHEIAKLSLYLAEHQMNVEFLRETGRINPTLPLKVGGNIVCENATRVDWEKVCPKNNNDEIYVLGNPPYLGARMQNKEHKKDIVYVFNKYGTDKKIDYISCWFLKASEFIKNIKAKFAFVSTNSICQGEQVGLIWPHILKNNLEIAFAYTSFKWTNNAKSNAGVICVIVGICNKGSKFKKIIFNKSGAQEVNNINPYLIDAKNVFIKRRSCPISFLPEMVYGELLNDGGYLILSSEEKNKILETCSLGTKIVKRLIGAKEFLRGEERWCLHIKENFLEEAMGSDFISERLRKVQEHRLRSTEQSTRKIANNPHRFYFSAYKNSISIIVPTVSSERRRYIPMGYLSPNDLIIAPNQAIYNAEPWIFGVISSSMHMIWVRAVAGRLKTDYRYSSALVYNTFPIPSLSTKQKEEITRHVYNILEEREKHSEKTISQLYDPEKMPASLMEAHHFLDLAVERCYRSKPFSNDEERLETLFKLYEQMIEEEKNKSNK